MRGLVGAASGRWRLLYIPVEHDELPPSTGGAQRARAAASHGGSEGALSWGLSSAPDPGAPICLVKVLSQDGGMTTWFRTYYEDEDLWLYFEADSEGWATRQVEVRRQDSRPVTAASLEEVLHLRDHADLAAMFSYERQFGVLAEGPMDGWQDQPEAAEISSEEFERVWTEARQVLGDSG